MFAGICTVSLVYALNVVQIRELFIIKLHPGDNYPQRSWALHRPGTWQRVGQRKRVSCQVVFPWPGVTSFWLVCPDSCSEHLRGLQTSEALCFCWVWTSHSKISSFFCSGWEAWWEYSLIPSDESPPSSSPAMADIWLARWFVVLQWFPVCWGFSFPSQSIDKLLNRKPQSIPPSPCHSVW